MKYYGPKGLLRPNVLSSFEDGHWLLQPKIDGAFCIVSFPHGRAQFISRDDKVLSKGHAKDLTEIEIPKELVKCKFIGELEAHRPWSLKRNEERGYNIVDLHDLIRDDEGNDLSKVPYENRLKLLWNILRPLDLSFRNRFSPLWFIERGFEERYRVLKEEGYEGAVLKKKDGLLTDHDREGKTKSQIKIKTWPDT